MFSSSIPKLLRHLMCSQKMRTGCDACDARPRLISSRTMRPGDGMKHCLVRKQEPSEFNSTGRKNTRNPRLISAGFTKNSCVPAWREDRAGGATRHYDMNGIAMKPGCQRLLPLTNSGSCISMTSAHVSVCVNSD